MMQRLFELIRRGWRKPPQVIARWLMRQAGAEWYQRSAPARDRAYDQGAVLSALGGQSLDILWTRLGAAPFPAYLGPMEQAKVEALCPGDAARILAAADDAVAHRVDFLGSGPVDLGTPIDWHTDFKSGHSWPTVPFRRIDVMDPYRDSDIKVPWELSRLQWLIPAGQAYMMTGEKRYADAVRNIIEDWAVSNPLAQGVNWACTMDVALRAITLVWLFHVFHRAAAWQDAGFRIRFLKLLYLHGDFTARHLEWSDINGNHLITDAAGLVVVGLFFGDADKPRKWQQRGWKILTDELPKQVFADGVDFEVSSAYHRLVTEIFLLPALYRRALSMDIPDDYAGRLIKMAEFTAAYSRADGSVPLWGDADDGRVLPFGGLNENINDHRYLIAIIGQAFGDDALAAPASGPMPEVLWTLGPGAAKAVADQPKSPGSRDFPDAGVYVMRGGEDHVFIDCGPVGMGGRGGHGHNDCLSFEAALRGQHLITDCGTYVYSADPKWRNDFRSTGFHNTPVVGGEEQNRFVKPEYLWSLHNDAAPQVRHWQTSDAADWFVGAHTGYHRLPNSVTPVRGIMLDKTSHRVAVIDSFEGSGDHGVRVPYHLALGVEALEEGQGRWRLKTAAGDFLVIADVGDDWTATLGDGWVSPSYGIKHPARVLNFIRHGPLAPLAVGFLPADDAPDDPLQWLADAVAGFKGAG
ncbi:MAG: alginate lyase family protein [Proteobacteria bacterium]|nr:alginate lyase family protein [Pseudomonadota bacterium]